MSWLKVGGFLACRTEDPFSSVITLLENEVARDEVSAMIIARVGRLTKTHRKRCQAHTAVNYVSVVSMRST